MTKQEIEMEYLKHGASIEAFETDTYTALGHAAWWGYNKGAQSRQPEINELVEALREATQWIDVGHNLTCVNVDILIRRRDEYIDKTGYYGYTGKSEPEFAFYTYDGGETVNVTHWRPIDSPKATELLKRYSHEQ
jgi:hypothetical protein